MEERTPFRSPAPGEPALAEVQRSLDGCLEEGEACRMDSNSRASQMEQIKGLERSGGIFYAEG